MTTSAIENATESAIKSASDFKIESAAVKSELPATETVTKVEEVKTKAPVKMNRKAAAKKPAAVPTQIQASTNSSKKLPLKASSKPTAKALPKLLPKAPATASAKVLGKLPPKVQAQKTAKPSIQVLVEKASKQKKPKLVRDSFTIPKAEYLVLDDLKQRAIKIGTPTKKSELLRAGIKALAAMTDAAFKSALSAVPTIKTGRPAKD